MPLAKTMTTQQANSVVEQVEAALAACQQFLPTGFACSAVARRIAECYQNDADGRSGFWIARAVRADGNRGVWDALTREEGEVLADVLTDLAL